MADQFRAAGLEPAGIDGYRQPMDFHVVQLDEAHCALDLLREGKAQPLQLGEDAVFAINSHAAEKVEAGAVFVGYGLTVPELHYNDLAGQDVKGKIVVFITGGPSDMAGPVKAHYQSTEERQRGSKKPELSVPSPYRIPGAPRCPGRGLPRPGSSHAWN